ncbi:MAG: hypothetical protein K2Y21_11590 [Phycisphaerales bacterium]|nr:hypothetical protein [Phycisphaerales bacterium]
MTTEERLEQMEKKVRLQGHILQAICGAAVFAVFMFWSGGSDTIRASDIRARRVTLVNEDGKRRGEIVSGDYDASVYLNFANDAKTSISVKQNQISLWMSDHQGNPTFSVLKEIESGVPVVRIGGFLESQSGLELRLGRDAPELKLFDKDGKVVWSAP